MNSLLHKILRRFFFLSSSISKSLLISLNNFLKVITTSKHTSNSFESLLLFVLIIELLVNSGAGLYGINTMTSSGFASVLFFSTKSDISFSIFILLNLSLNESMSIVNDEFIFLKQVMNNPKIVFIFE